MTLRIPKQFLILLFSLFTLLLVGSIAAQSDSEECGNIVQEALEITSDICADMGRNQVCYGNSMVSVQTWDDTQLNFTNPGDIDDVTNLAALQTYPFNLEDETWGIAIMSLQANLPDTLPGQNVTFVLFGDVEIQNEVSPNKIVDLSTLSGQANANANLRSGPGTGYGIAGSLTTGQDITFVGRNEAADWFQISTEEGSAWVFASLVNIEDDVSILPVVAANAGAASSISPMQAFSLSTGIGETTCAEVPRDGIMIQAPEETTVYLTINGVEVSIGSTALIRLNENDDSMSIANLDGSVIVGTGDEAVELDTSYQVDVSADTTASEPQAIEFEDVRGLPTNLLPESIQIAPPGRQYSASPTFCFFNDDRTQLARAGETIAFRTGWLDSLDNTQAAREIPLRLTLDGTEVEPWGITDPVPRPHDTGMNYLVWRYWVVSDIQPGQHEVMIIGMEAFNNISIDLVQGPIVDAPCVFTVQ